jgi:hypothetical protein
MLKRYRGWSGAVTVMVITAALVVLDISDRSVHRYWSRHAFTSSVLSGVLVLLLTILIVDRVIRVRQLKDQSRVMGAQAAVILAQAKRAVDAIAHTSPSADGREDASGELRTYTQMLLTSAPLLIGSRVPRRFLETAQRVAAELFRALQAGNENAEATQQELDHAVKALREAAAPLLRALSSQQRAALSSDA